MYKFCKHTKPKMEDGLPINSEKISDEKPENIKQIYACYSVFYIILKNGKSYSHQTSTNKLLEANLPSDVIFPSYSVGDKLVWSRENHKFWSLAFKETIFHLLLCFLFHNKKKPHSKVPKVLIFLIISIYSKENF